MDIVDWIPISGAIKSFGKKAKGTHLWDYSYYAGREDCEFRIGELAAIYCARRVPFGLGKSIIDFGVGYGARKFAEKTGKTLLGTSMILLGAVDFGLSWTKIFNDIMEIRKTAMEAVKVYCGCKYKNAQKNPLTPKL